MYSLTHSFTHSLIPGVHRHRLCLMGRHAGLWLSPLTHAFILHLQHRGPFPGGWNPAPEGEHRQEADQHCTDGRGNVGSPPPWGELQWLPLFQGQWQSGKTCLWPGSAPGLPSHCTLLQCQTRQNPPPQARPSRNCCCFVGIVMWGHHLFLAGVPGSGDHAGTHPSVPLREPCTLSRRELVSLSVSGKAEGTAKCSSLG